MTEFDVTLKTVILVAVSTQQRGQTIVFRKHFSKDKGWHQFAIIEHLKHLNGSFSSIL